jgi:hypothetical protein
MLEDLTPRTNRGRGYCKVRAIRETLEPGDQELLDKYLEDTVTWSSLALSEALSQKGLRISVHPVIRHRKGLCVC